MSSKDDLRHELDRLQTHLPAWAARPVARVRKSGSFWVRLVLAIALIAGGIVGFLPVLGFWMIPFGLALLAIDLPFLRAPLAKGLGYVNRKLSAA